jgi:hypothetical protein
MTLYEEIIAIYPELSIDNFEPRRGQIGLSDDGDGIVYISKWEYSKPLPDGMKVGK